MGSHLPGSPWLRALESSDAEARCPRIRGRTHPLREEPPPGLEEQGTVGLAPGPVWDTMKEALRVTNQLASHESRVPSQEGQEKGPYGPLGQSCPDPTCLGHRTVPSSLGGPALSPSPNHATFTRASWPLRGPAMGGTGTSTSGCICQPSCLCGQCAHLPQNPPHNTGTRTDPQFKMHGRFTGQNLGYQDT